ncbi:MAG: UDP-3-O-(3-hydroxymyristoyl)glucosamine N-acyltransferase [Muribaculaceae bacterium]|nr:UDP-3-O-(3-hydroxymyristoyl)glucosamine N-acyltransferase [Muribaculaceae bacterium]
MQLTADIIARHLGGDIDGRSDVEVSTFAKIEVARQGDITFLANPKYTPYIYTTQASAVLVRRDFVPEHPVSATLIRVDDPYSALASLLELHARHIQPPRPQGIEPQSYVAPDVEIPEGCYVGAFSYIAQGARIGKNVLIYPQCYIGPGVVIGDDTVVYPGVKIYYNCQIGQRCVLHSGVVIGSDGFGFAPDANGVFHKIEQVGIVRIDDDVEIGANTTIDRSTMGATHIERGVKLDNLIQIAHNVTVGHDTVMASQVGVAGSTSIGAHCMVGGQVGFAGHIQVADGTSIGAQSGISKSIPEGAKMMGSPAVPWSEYARTVAAWKKLPDALRLLAKLEKEK